MARQIISPGEGQKSYLWPSMASQLPHPQWPSWRAGHERPNNHLAPPLAGALPQGSSKSDRVDLREGSHRSLTAAGAASAALLLVHPSGGIQGASPPWRPLVVINLNNKNNILLHYMYRNGTSPAPINQRNHSTQTAQDRESERCCPTATAGATADSCMPTPVGGIWGAERPGEKEETSGESEGH